jgi:hypothetical protein
MKIWPALEICCMEIRISLKRAPAEVHAAGEGVSFEVSALELNAREIKKTSSRVRFPLRPRFPSRFAL